MLREKQMMDEKENEMNKRCILKGISHEIGWLVFSDGILLINYHNLLDIR